MLLDLSLRNFKAFGDREQIAPMSKVTLLFGPNSGGKSSIIQAILMLKQSVLEAGSAATIWGLVTRGEYVDLGSHMALLHNHDAKNPLAIGMSYDAGGSRVGARMEFGGVADIDDRGKTYVEDSAIVSKVSYHIADGGEILAEAKLEHTAGSWWTAQVSAGGVTAVHDILDFGADNNLLPELKLVELETLIERHQEDLPERERSLVRERGRMRRAEREDEMRRVEELERMSGEDFVRLPPLDRDLPQARARMQALAREPEADLLRALESKLSLAQMMDLKQMPVSFRERMTGVRYLGPLRGYPERLYRIPGVDSYFSGPRGEYAHHRLYYQPGLIPLVNEWFTRFEIPYELEVRRVGDIAVSGEHIALACRS